MAKKWYKDVLSLIYINNLTSRLTFHPVTICLVRLSLPLFRPPDMAPGQGFLVISRWRLLPVQLGSFQYWCFSLPGRLHPIHGHSYRGHSLWSQRVDSILIQSDMFLHAYCMVDPGFSWFWKFVERLFRPDWPSLQCHFRAGNACHTPRPLLSYHRRLWWFWIGHLMQSLGLLSERLSTGR